MKTTPDLTAEGKKIAEDAEKLLEATERFLSEKNPDELLQKMVKEGQEAISEMSQGIEYGKVPSLSPMELEAMQKDAQSLYENGRDLILALIRSGDIRDLFADAIEVLQNLLEVKKSQLETQPPTYTQQKVAEGKIESPQQVGQAFKEAMELPQEEKENLRKMTEDKFMNFLGKLGAKEEYKVAVRNSFAIVESMRRRTERFQHEMPDWEEIPGLNKLELAMRDAMKILSRFTGKPHLRKFKYLWRGLWNDFMNDVELRDSLWKFKNFTLECVEKPQLLQVESKRQEGRKILENLRFQTQKENYRKRLQEIYDEVSIMLDTVKRDSTSQEFQMRLEQFTKDFALNKEGKPDVWVLGNSVDQLRIIMGPILRTFLENIPIDRVDILGPNYDVTIKDLKISGADIMPNQMDFRLDNKIHLDLKKGESNIARTRFVAIIREIKPKFHNVKFHYIRKSFPKIEDFGVANLLFTGDGASIKLVWELRSEPGKPTYAVLLENRCKIDSISIEINSSQTKHSLLDRFFAVILQQRIKYEIAAGIEDYINKNIQPLNEQINTFFGQNPWEVLKLKATQQISEGLKSLQIA